MLVVGTLYHDIVTAVSNNGHFSEFFNPTRGIRQGCPISANIFVIIAEILASAILQNPRIIGITIGKKTYKISQYADDTVIFLNDEDSLKNVFIILDIFTKCSGLKANREKSEAIWISASSNYKHKPLGIKWPNTPIKCLGIYLQNDHQKLIDDNFNRVLEKIENILKLWCLRKLTLTGRIVIINTLIISQMIYLCLVLHTPDKIITKFNKLILDFLWDRKPAKVKYTSMINSIESGGLKLQDLGCKIESLKLKWLKLLINTDYEAPWKTYLNTKFKYFGINEILYYNMDKNDYPILSDKFYAEMFKTWSKIHYNKPTNVEDICN
jgi:hypothetical protein